MPPADGMYYFEDLQAGMVFEFGDHTVTRDEIVEFASQWIPQVFHTDPEAAASGPFGSLIASGWHTACVFMRLYYEGLLSRSSSLGSPGVDELRWLSPVRPGDRLTGRATVLQATPSTRRPELGSVVMDWECLRGPSAVLTMRGIGLFARRAAHQAG